MIDSILNDNPSCTLPVQTNSITEVERICLLGRQIGPLSTQITVHGLPIRPAFSKKLAPKHQLRRSLGLERDVPIVLLVGECLHSSAQSQQSSYPENVKMSQGAFSAC